MLHQGQQFRIHKYDETIRVKIWRALVTGNEMTLKELGEAIGQHQGLKSHLMHVTRQAETLKNKSNDWRKRRGFAIVLDGAEKRRINKL